jgi:hypothetical protein
MKFFSGFESLSSCGRIKPLDSREMISSPSIVCVSEAYDRLLSLFIYYLSLSACLSVCLFVCLSVSPSVCFLQSLV